MNAVVLPSFALYHIMHYETLSFEFGYKMKSGPLKSFESALTADSDSGFIQSLKSHFEPVC